MAIALINFLSTQGGERYTYTGKNGINFISSTSIPEKHERRVQKIDSSNTMTSSDKSARENKNNTQHIQYKKDLEGMGKLLLLYSIFR